MFKQITSSLNSVRSQRQDKPLYFSKLLSKTPDTK